MNPDDQEHPDWLQFDHVSAKAKTLIDRLPDGFHKDQTRAKLAELCYWFNEAHIEANEPCANVADYEAEGAWEREPMGSGWK